jgi:hypothetical protein
MMRKANDDNATAVVNILWGILSSQKHARYCKGLSL